MAGTAAERFCRAAGPCLGPGGRRAAQSQCSRRCRRSGTDGVPLSPTNDGSVSALGAGTIELTDGRDVALLSPTLEGSVSPLGIVIIPLEVAARVRRVRAQAVRPARQDVSLIRRSDAQFRGHGHARGAQRQRFHPHLQAL